MSLLPCPFCGRVPSEEYYQRRYDFDFAIECECGACLSQCEWAGGPGQESKEKTIEQWNTRAIHGWVSCDDRMPPDGHDSYIVSNKYGQIYLADRDMNRSAKWVWVDDEGTEIGLTFGYPVTHWMPLPSAPRTAPNAKTSGPTADTASTPGVGGSAASPG
jgi:hypothetical protein